MIVYQVLGNEIVRIPPSFLKRRKGVYGWYVLRQDLELLGPEFKLSTSNEPNGTPERIYLYIGTVKGGPRRSVAARFVGELLGSQISTDMQKSFDTDFAVSCAVDFLCQKGMDVYFDVLGDVHGTDEEMRIARDKRPLLQKVTAKKVFLHTDIKRKMAGTLLDEKTLEAEIVAVGEAVLRRLKEAISQSRADSPPCSGA
jgi:hypothetical protein